MLTTRGYIQTLAILHSLFITITATTSAYFLSCGAITSTNFSSDEPPRLFVPDNAILRSSSASVSVSASSNSPHVNSSSLYATARIFTAASTYRFQLNSTGSHVLRLHFSAFSADNYDLSSARFDVTALQHFTLLVNFSVSSADSPVIKEYFLWVNSGQGFDLSFTPSVGNSSFAFVNAIELFVAPTAITEDKNHVGIPVGQLNYQALETVYRLNVGGQLVTPQNDTLWRTWSPDDSYLHEIGASATKNVSSDEVKYRPEDNYTEKVAPRSVYSTARIMNVTDYDITVNNLAFNVTWNFTVDAGYKYLIRLHFCDFISGSFADTIAFDVYVGNFSYLDLQSQRYTDNIMEAFYLDFGVDGPSEGPLLVSIGRSDKETDPGTANAYLNGLEIFKVNNSDGSLNSSLVIHDRPEKHKNRTSIIIGASIGGGIILLSFVILYLFICKKRRSKTETETPRLWAPYQRNSINIVNSSDGSTGPGVSPFNNFGLQIPLVAIKAATNDFDDAFVIGTGGFGKVYKGFCSDGTIVAVKRGSGESQQGYPAFQTEIILLSQVRHKHLVSLIGYCEEQGERILVYEFMEKGTLRDYLYGCPDNPALSWKQRLEICIDAAKGLHYLHTGFTHTIIHRDVKSTNILLGENYIAKVSDFGLSKLRPSDTQTTVSTDIKGTFGYMDPQYFRTKKLSEKSDVYSFGVMLFEVLCARPVIERGVMDEQLNLAEWAMQWQRRGQLDKVIDARLVGKINMNSLRKFGETAEKCLADYGEDRPTFGDVLWNLEYALQLQQTELRREPLDDSQVDVSQSQIPVVPPVRSSREENEESDNVDSNRANINGDEEMSRFDLGHSTMTTSSVFSQLIGSEGR